MWDFGTTDGWWLGWCPKHDEERDADKATAEYNFQLDQFKCCAEPSCHTGRSRVPLNLADAWRQGYDSLRAMRSGRAIAKRRRQEFKRREQSEARKDKAAERQSKREQVARAEVHRDRLIKRYPQVDVELMPSRSLIMKWDEWIEWTLPPITSSHADGWWNGWCPLHEKPTGGGFSALFNFRVGSYKCLNEPACHAPKKGMTLVHLASAMEAARRG